MRKLWSILTLLTMAATLTACGGDSGAFTTPSSSAATSATVAKLTVTPSVATLPPDGTTATITVTATSGSNVAVSGAPVTFATSTGTLAVTSATTSATGQATATLAAPGVAAGTVITITATSGSVSGKATVTVANTQQTLTLSTSVPQIPSAAGATPATIKALLVDASNNVVPGATVSFQATSGALTVTQGTTDATGTAIATLSAGTSAQNRVITVTATAGASTATIQIAVIGTTLTLSGPTSLVLAAAGTYTVTLNDSGGNAIIGQPIAITSANGNAINTTPVTTGNQGTATFTVTAAKAGTDTITATAYDGSLPATQQVSISNQAFTITAPAANATIAVGSTNAVPVTVTWTASGAGQSGTVNFTTSRGTVSPASVTVTGGTMAQTVTLYSTTAGTATLQASAILTGTTTTVASAQTQLSFYAPVSTAAAISVQANPARVATQGQSTVVASVVDGTGNPVQGATVDFTLTDSTGGSISSGSAVTNSSGQATVTYTAGTISSATNGVSIAVQVSGTSLTNNTQLTVGGQTVFLSLGTGNSIEDYSSSPNTQYELPYSVQAADASGAGLNGVTVTFSVQSIAYYTGQMAYLSSIWQPVYAVPAPNSACAPVYVYENAGVIESPPPSPVPSNYVLTLIPGSVVTTDVSSAVTTAAGSANVNLIYPKDHAYWVQVALTATATVSGTQNSTTAQFILPGLSTDYTTQTNAPPGQISPYGVATSCYPNAQ
jgi:Bacterial Ig-like domain (group 1)